MMLCIVSLNTMGSSGLMATDDPVVQLDDGGRLFLGLPAGILAHKEVAEHLKTGLTLTFVHTVGLRLESGSKKAVARLNVRYELWDEVYLIECYSYAGPPLKLTFETMEELVQWWRGANIFIASYGSDRGLLSGARVIVDVLPFSATEQKTAQAWFTRSTKLIKPSSGGKPDSDAIDAFLATAIQRKPLLSFRWTVDIVE